jgi:hypothetical protein
VQEDNVMLEFNIPPASNSKDFSTSIKKMMEYLKKEMLGKGLDLNTKSVMFFKPEQLTSEQARKFGCEPDYCVWSRTVNEINKMSPVLETMRTAAAHVHISYKYHGRDPDLEDQELLVKLLDIFLGAPSIAMYANSKERREFYGKAGSFRPKPYGLEYRVLGNEWLKDPSSVFNAVKLTIDFINYYGEQEAQATAALNSKNAIRVINNGDVLLASKFHYAMEEQQKYINKARALSVKAA